MYCTYKHQLMCSTAFCLKYVIEITVTARNDRKKLRTLCKIWLHLLMKKKHLLMSRSKAHNLTLPSIITVTIASSMCWTKNNLSRKLWGSWGLLRLVSTYFMRHSLVALSIIKILTLNLRSLASASWVTRCSHILWTNTTWTNFLLPSGWAFT